ncbi:MAG TPA: dihydrolipoyl dehydrogenase [Propionibacteriaceae bacterium]|nr:dihydrolipoyl dehydrogenase [Propionibacteriaceae bacterium]
MDAPFDLVVLGGGSGGYACALRAAELGLNVALVERDLVGGTCLHRGCIPTKALLHAAEVADAARNGSTFGIHTTIDKVDLAGVRAYADSVVGRLYKGLTGLVGSRGITVVNGIGRLVQTADGPGVEVGEETFVGRRVVLATGSYARTLPGVAIDQATILTSDGALRLDTLPSSAIVLGGGVIGVEFASAWRSLGVEVTLVEALPRLLPAEDPEISAALERAYRRRKITVRTGQDMRSAERTQTGVRLTLANGDSLSAEVLLVAVGRGPVTDGLGYAEAGVALDRGYVAVDKRLQTTVAGVYAVGDLVGGLQLAHRGFAHGVFAAEEIAADLGRGERPAALVADADIPRVAYCEPEVASVGLSEQAARERLGEVDTVTFDLAGNGRSQILKTSGFVKLIRQPNGPVVGVTMIGARVSELIAEAQLITNWEAFPSDVAALIHPHPTQSEALGEAHLALAGKPLHVHG